MCNAEELACVKHVLTSNVHMSNCLEPCAGVYITSFSKSDTVKHVENKLCGCYWKYTKWTKLPSDMKGIYLVRLFDSISTISKLIIRLSMGE